MGSEEGVKVLEEGDVIRIPVRVEKREAGRSEFAGRTRRNPPGVDGGGG